MTTALDGKKIVLCVSGGIAAYKAVELLRLLTRSGADVRVLMTAHATEFVAPLTFATLSGKPVCTDLFRSSDMDAAVGHIEWAQEAQAVVIAPATANLVAKYACGLADDAVSTFLLAATCPVVICPSMNSDMYLSPPVQRNLEILTSDGHLVLTPGAGDLACKTVGIGRLPEPAEILDRLAARLTPKDLAGKTVLVTAGPTREAIDPVRFVSNPSSGKMGYAVARAAEYRGATVILVSGPVHLPDPAGVTVIRVESAAEMAEAVFAHAGTADVVVKTAAVSDYRPESPADHKLKKGEGAETLTFVRTIDILKRLGDTKTHQILVGFAAETRNLEEYAVRKLAEKNLDMIVANLVVGEGSAFAGDTSSATLFHRGGGSEAFGAMPKDALAHAILDRVRARLP